jgi:succinyl-diaminopimelate desuccinylase
VAEDFLSWAERFIATPSVSCDGNRAMAELAAELLELAGLEVELQRAPGPPPEQINVIAEAGPETGRDLLLVTHLDTVPPGDPTLWTATGGDPYRPTRVEDRLYGLGSADAKVDLVCKAFALNATDLRRLRRRVRVVGTFGEEIGQLGARYLIETGKTRGYEFALVGEPSELVAICAHKGYAVFEARIPLARMKEAPPARLERLCLRGASAHSSTPDLGRNAIELAIQRLAEPDIAGLVDIEGGDQVNCVPERCTLEVGFPAPSARDSTEKEMLDPEPLLAFLNKWQEILSSLADRLDPEFDPDHTVGNLGRIALEGTDAVVRFDLRTVPGVDPEAAVKPLARVARIRCVRANPALSTPTDSAMVRAVIDAQQCAGVPPRVGTKATSTEAGLLAASGTEAVVLGPGRSVGNVHRPNEHTLVSQLNQAVELYRRLVDKLCGQEASPCSC